MASVNRTERLHALTESLRRAGPEGVGAQRLATELEVTTRTVKRDVAALVAGGLPVWARPGPRGGYGLAATGSLPPIALSATQALALLAAVSAAPHAPFADSARAAVRKVEDVLDPGTRARAADLARRVWVDSTPGPPRSVLAPLEQALIDQVTVVVDYTDRAGTASHREVEPMILAHTGGRWYLVAWCRWRDAVRWFDMARVRRATATRRGCSGHDVAEVGRPPETAHPVHA